MSVSLNGIALDDSLALLNFQNRVALPHSVHYGLLGGVTVQQADAVEAGSILTLEARQDGERIYGKYSKTQVEQINALLGQEIPLVHHLGSWTVRLLDRSFTPVDDIADPASGDWYVGTISLLITG